MTFEETKRLKALFVATAMYYSQEIQDAALALYVSDLADLNFSDCEKALQTLRRDPKVRRCPLPADIRATVQPEADPESLGILVANEIVELIARVGPYQTPRLSDIARQVVAMEGGWQQVCIAIESNDQLPAFKAQWRNLAKTLAMQKKREEFTALPPPDRPRGGGLRSVSFTDVIRQIGDQKYATPPKDTTEDSV